MIYLQTGILILEVFLCLLLNNLLKNKLNKKYDTPFVSHYPIVLIAIIQLIRVIIIIHEESKKR